MKIFLCLRDCTCGRVNIKLFADGHVEITLTTTVHQRQYQQPLCDTEVTSASSFRHHLGDIHGLLRAGLKIFGGKKTLNGTESNSGLAVNPES